MDFLVLGPIVATGDEGPVRLGGPKQRTVLALLVADVDRIVSVDALIEGVWGSHPTTGARSTLQSHVSNLRGALGEVIVREGGGYRLLAGRDQVDAFRFEAEVAEAAPLLESRPVEVAQRLREALALWRGHPYADVTGTVRLEEEARRLEELRLRAVELRVEADLALGCHAELAAELEVLAAEFPLRERFRYLHMLSLYRSGRQAEALRACQRTRVYLREELGVDPSPDVRQLEQRILEQDPTLTWEVEPRIETVALLLTDVERPDETLQRGASTTSEFVDELEQVMSGMVERAGGRVVSRQGGCLQAVFADVAAAVTAARDAPQALAGIDVDGTGHRVVMAIDVGEVETRDGQVFGPVLNRCGRILATGHGGQILMTGDAHAALAAGAGSGWQVKALGEFLFQGVGHPQAVFQLVVDGLPSTFPPLRIDQLPPPLAVAAPGRSVRGYELREQVGSGGLGVVYRAYQPAMGREVAIKAIRPELVNEPDFVRRFEAEARLVAQLEHPHIVSLYDYWRDPDGAYLVMRWLRGGSLRAALELGSWHIGAVLRLLDEVGGALAYAHRRGMVHRDLHPGNILLDDDGSAYLSDLGLAASLTGRAHAGSPVASTPAYRAPEEYTGGAATPRTDLYALGLVAFELFSGQRPSMDTALPPLDRLRPALPAAIGSAISRATTPDPTDRFESVEDLLAALQEGAGGDGAVEHGTSFTPSRNPYKGLHAFDEPDAADFFGRDRLVEQLVDAVEQHRLVGVVGPSGVGKSSVVRAGLIPALRSSEELLITDMLPGTSPFDELAAALLRVAVDRPEQLPDQLARDELGMVRVTRRILPAETVLIIDQFEELFTLTAEDIRRRFLDGLVALATASHSQVRVVVTLRADFLDRPLRYAEFGQLLRSGMVTVTAPSADETVETIERPARAVGIRFEPGLVSHILGDLDRQPGAIPLLQYALTDLFDSRTSDLLTVDAYQQRGGVLGALGSRAEELYQDLDEQGRQAVRQCFLRLVAVDPNGQDTRRRVPRRELRRLEVDQTSVEEVLGRYGQQRLLTFDRDPLTRSPTVEVAHEALLTRWERLHRWVDEQRGDLLRHRRFTEAAAEWEVHDHDPAYLLRGGRLHEFESWAETTGLSLTGDERHYLAESRRVEDRDRTRRRRQRRAVLVGFAAAAVVMTVLAGLAMLAGRDAVAQRDAAQRAEGRETARRLASNSSLALSEDPQLAILLALEGVAVSREAGEPPPPEVISALHRAVQTSRLEMRIDAGAARVAISPDGALLATDSWDPERDRPGEDVLIWDPDSGERLRTLRGEHRVGDVAFSPDGNLLAATYWESVEGSEQGHGHIVLWDPTTGRQVNRFGHPATHVAWSPDGALLATASPVGFAVRVVTTWEVDTGEELFSTPDGGPGIAFLDEQTLLVGDRTGAQVTFHDAHTGEVTDHIALPDAMPMSLGVDRDRGRLVVGLIAASEDRIEVWDLRSRMLEWSRPVAAASPWMTMDPVTQMVAAPSWGGPVILLDLDDGMPVIELPGHVGNSSGITFYPDGERLAAVGDGDAGTLIWDITPAGPRPLGSLEVEEPRFVRVSPDGTEVAVTYEGGFQRFDLLTAAPLDSVESPNISWDLPAPLSGDWDAVAFVDPSGDAWVRGLLTGDTISHLPPCTVPKALSHDGSVLALDGLGLCQQADAPSDAELRSRVIAVATGEELLDLGPHGVTGATGAVFNPGGAFAADRFLALARPDPGRLEIYDLNVGALLSTVEEVDFLGVLGLTFDPTGRYLAVGTVDGRSFVVDLAQVTDGFPIDEAIVFDHTVDTGAVPGVALNADGILATSAFGSLRLWDIHTGALLVELAVDIEWPPHSAFSPDGDELYYGDTTHQGSVLRRFPVDAGELVAFAEDRLTREMTDDECHRYLDPDRCR